MCVAIAGRDGSWQIRSTVLWLIQLDSCLPHVIWEPDQSGLGILIVWLPRHPSIDVT